MSLYDDIAKYESSISSLGVVDSNISELIVKITGLKNDLINNLNIDNKGLEEDNLNNAIQTLSGSSNTINSNYIPSLKQKIEETKAEIARQEEEEKKKKEEEEKKRKEQESNS